MQRRIFCCFFIFCKGKRKLIYEVKSKEKHKTYLKCMQRGIFCWFFVEGKEKCIFKVKSNERKKTYL